ncbi:MAG: hypothetical protein JXB49_22120 [Bacteroidales bacterium]|nr:hypothetical protein [Bacteroidales bacterium]
MKKIYLYSILAIGVGIIFLSYLFFFVQNPLNISSLELDGLNGKVKYTIERKYEIEFFDDEIGNHEISDVEYETREFNYNEEGNIVCIESNNIYVHSGGYITKQIFIYKKGKLSESKWYTVNDNLLYTYKFQAIFFNKIKSIGFYKGEESIKTIAYYKNKRLLKSVTTGLNEQNGMDSDILQLYYYDNNNIVMIQVNSKFTGSYSNKYEYLEYDEYGNWTKKIEYIPENGQEPSPEYIVYRKIEYFGKSESEVSIQNEESAPMNIEPISNSGDGFGQITFSQNDKLLIFYTQKEQKGTIQINGISHNITSCKFENSTYQLKGDGLIITAKDLIDQGVGDCYHYSCPFLNISLNGESKILNDIRIQDCLSFSWD